MMLGTIILILCGIYVPGTVLGHECPPPTIIYKEVTVYVKRSMIIDAWDGQNYLLRFGYMTPARASNLRQPDGRREDNPLKKAIKMFQRVVHINQTGEFDNTTLKWMNTRRCGMPDTNMARNHSWGHHHRTRRYAFGGTQWNKTDLTYRITRYTGSLPMDMVDREIAMAFKAWSDVTPLNFCPKAEGPVDTEIFFASGEHGDGDPFDGESGTLAHAYYPPYPNSDNELAGDTHFDDAERWTINSNEGTNLYLTAVHEFGHSLGLDHSDVEGAFMLPFIAEYNPDDPYPKLHQDDIRGIQELYGYDTPRTHNCPDYSTTESPFWPTRNPPLTKRPTWYPPYTQKPTWYPTQRPTWYPPYTHRPTWYPTHRPTWYSPNTQTTTWHPPYTPRPTWYPTQRPTWYPPYTQRPTWHPPYTHRPTWYPRPSTRSPVPMSTRRKYTKHNTYPTWPRPKPTQPHYRPTADPSDRCNGKVDGVLVGYSTETILIIRGDYVFKVYTEEGGVAHGYPKYLDSVFENGPSYIDAAFKFTPKRSNLRHKIGTYLFQGNRCWKYTYNSRRGYTLGQGYPKDIYDEWGIDLHGEPLKAVFMFSTTKIIFVTENVYWEHFGGATPRHGFPRRNSHHPLLKDFDTVDDITMTSISNGFVFHGEFVTRWTRTRRQGIVLFQVQKTAVLFLDCEDDEGPASKSKHHHKSKGHKSKGHKSKGHKSKGHKSKHHKSKRRHL